MVSGVFEVTHARDALTPWRSTIIDHDEPARRERKNAEVSELDPWIGIVVSLHGERRAFACA